MADNDTQAAALAAALAPLVAQAIQKDLDTKLSEMDKAVSDRLDAVASKNADLLSKLHQEKGTRLTLEEQMANLSKALSGKQKETEIVLSKDDARDVRKYRQARERAQKEGLSVRIDRNA